jgi:uncharacterized membrane protein YdbT with pleckstrin-like domain
MRMTDGTDHFRSSTWGWLRGTLAGWGTLALVVGGFGLMVVASIVGFGIPTAAPLLLSLAGLAIIGWVWVQNMASSYEITPDRLILRRGIFNKSIDEIELYRVKDVRLDFTLINQMAGIGTIGITSSDSTTSAAPLTMPHVERAQARREELRTLVEAARQKRRVREIDMLHEDL